MIMDHSIPVHEFYHPVPRVAGPSSMSISGVNIMTVGVPYAFRCAALCSPACTYSWTTGGHNTTGAELSLQLKTLTSPHDVVTCQARNPASGRTATLSKTLAVTGKWSGSRHGYSSL